MLQNFNKNNFQNLRKQLMIEYAKAFASLLFLKAF